LRSRIADCGCCALPRGIGRAKSTKAPREGTRPTENTAILAPL
jgi:hypothetical protein